MLRFVMQPIPRREAAVARRWKVLAVVSTAVFMSSLDLFIVNIAFPDIRSDFPGTSLAGLSWILNAYAIVFAALLVPAGRSPPRLRVRLRRAAGAGRALGRPARAPAQLPGRRRALHVRLGAVGARAVRAA